MRGSPLLRAFLVFFAILLLGYPLHRLTRTTTVAEVQPLLAKTQKIGLLLTFTTRPDSMRVRHLGKEIWSENQVNTLMEKELFLPYPKEGIDRAFDLHWPASSSVAALRVTFTGPDGESMEKSIWGSGDVSEVLTFP